MNAPSVNRNRLLAGVLLVAAVLSLTPLVDRQAEGDYESLFQRAFVTFALARTLNGVISAVQGTELALQPAGVGLTLTPGELLDPVNDLVERFSWIMLGATVSLGIQQVLMEISAAWLIKGVLAVLAVWLAVLYLTKSRPPPAYKTLLLRGFLIVLFLRFAVPLTLIANNAMYDLFLEQRYTESSQVVSEAGEDIRQIGQETEVQTENTGQDGLIGSISRAFDNTRETLDVGERVARIKQRAASMIEHLIQLSVVFILQTGVLPIAFLWLFLQAARRVLSFSGGK